MKDLNKLLVFIPVSDLEYYADWDDGYGFGGTDQIDLEDGIVVKKEREEEFRSNVAEFEKHKKRFE